MVTRKLSYPNFKMMRQALRETESYIRELVGKPYTIDRDDFLDFYFNGANKRMLRQSLSDTIMGALKQVAEREKDGPIVLHENGDMTVNSKLPMPPYMYWVVTGKEQVIQPLEGIVVNEPQDEQA